LVCIAVHPDDFRAGLRQSALHVLGHGVIQVDAADPAFEQLLRDHGVHDRLRAVTRTRAEQRIRDHVFARVRCVEGRRRALRDHFAWARAAFRVGESQRFQPVQAQFIGFSHPATHFGEAVQPHAGGLLAQVRRRAADAHVGVVCLVVGLGAHEAQRVVRQDLHMAREHRQRFLGETDPALMVAVRIGDLELARDLGESRLRRCVR
jgi:hypothetical protein